MNVNVNASSAVSAVTANPKFQELVKARSGLAWTLTAIMLVIYFGFILLVAFDKPFLAQKVAGQVTTLGIFVGLGVLISAFVLVAIYVAVANTKFDRMTETLRRELGQ